MIQTSPETLPVTLPETIPKTNQTTEIAQLTENKIILVHRILSNRHIDLSDFSSAALSSVAVATATPPSSALHMKKSSCVNIAET